MVDEHDLEGIPHTVTNIPQHLSICILAIGELTRCTIASLSSPTNFIRTSRMNGVDRRTCGVDPNRIHELIEGCRTSGPPLEDGETPGADMEGKKFDQVSCLHPSPLRQGIVRGNSEMLTVD